MLTIGKVAVSPSARVILKVAACACVCALIFLSLAPRDVMVRTGAPKIAEHFVAYAGTTALILLAWGGTSGVRFRLLAAVVVLAGVLEYSQRWSPGREPGFDTFFASAAGACFAALVVSGLATWWLRAGDRMRA